MSSNSTSSKPFQRKWNDEEIQWCLDNRYLCVSFKAQVLADAFNRQFPGPVPINANQARYIVDTYRKNPNFNQRGEHVDGPAGPVDVAAGPTHVAAGPVDTVGPVVDAAGGAQADGPAVQPAEQQFPFLPRVWISGMTYYQGPHDTCTILGAHRHNSKGEIVFPSADIYQIVWFTQGDAALRAGFRDGWQQAGGLAEDLPQSYRMSPVQQAAYDAAQQVAAQTPPVLPQPAQHQQTRQAQPSQEQNTHLHLHQTPRSSHRTQPATATTTAGLNTQLSALQQPPPVHHRRLPWDPRMPANPGSGAMSTGGVEKEDGSGEAK